MQGVLLAEHDVCPRWPSRQHRRPACMRASPAAHSMPQPGTSMLLLLLVCLHRSVCAPAASCLPCLGSVAQAGDNIQQPARVLVYRHLRLCWCGKRRLHLRRYCQDCQAGVGTCTVCKEQGRAGIDVFKCRLPSCGHFYHGSCLQDIQPHFASRLMRHAPALRQLLPPSSAASHRARGPPRRLTQISGFCGA